MIRVMNRVNDIVCAAMRAPLCACGKARATRTRKGKANVLLQVQDDVSQYRHKEQEANQEVIRNKEIAPGYNMQGFMYGTLRTRLLILLPTSGTSSQRCCDETRKG